MDCIRDSLETRSAPFLLEVEVGWLVFRPIVGAFSPRVPPTGVVQPKVGFDARKDVVFARE